MMFRGQTPLKVRCGVINGCFLSGMTMFRDKPWGQNDVFGDKWGQTPLKVRCSVINGCLLNSMAMFGDKLFEERYIVIIECLRLIENEFLLYIAKIKYG